ncbi:hypothetical protein GPX89_10795 [Nocardia sp. ET3-3]|uniref:DUF3325 domain-containing protein n=1 Tax=Nocardia terrae TaxID=2675851 RepID=A0A7K1UTP5_9NOCA|nr:hypothetical protein [Nocardia terrae]MVU77727.1 hypothetical protein [Nocardia terrae]
MSPAVETLLLGGYAVAQLGAALRLDAMARGSRRFARAGRIHRRGALGLVSLSAVFLVVAVLRQPLDFLAVLPFSLAWAGVAWVLTAHLRPPLHRR